MLRTYLTLTLLFFASQLGGGALPAHSGIAKLERKVGTTMHATGTFVVRIAPAEASAIGSEAGLGRMTIDKSFSGDLEATSKGEMLTGGTDATGAMAYVAVERVTGKLGSRSGSFLLMHNATMVKSDPKAAMLNITVVPHSGMGDLSDITGKMTITIENGNHSYDFDYQLP